MKLRLQCVEAWAVVGLFAACCGFMGAVVWNGAQPRDLNFERAKQEVINDVNPEVAVDRLRDLMVDAILVLQNAALTNDRRGQLARHALKAIEDEARR